MFSTPLHLQALTTLRAHPRHHILAALVAGLLLGRTVPALVVVAALIAAALASRPWVAALAGVAVLGGATFTDARLSALDAGVLASSHGRTLETRAVVLEPVRARGFGGSAARVRLLDGPAAGEQAVLHARAWPAKAGVGDIVRVRGRVSPLGFADAYQRRRNAHAAVVAYAVTSDGQRRGGVAGRLDAIRRRAEAGLDRGLAPRDAALLRGMVLGEDEQLGDEVREDFQRSGLAHILAVSGSNVMLLAALVLGLCGLVGVPLRTRLVLAAAVIVLYVPLAGGGPSIQRAGVMGVAGLVAALAGRPARRWYALLLAAALTLALNPRAAEEPGWQLSFVAVAALLVGAPPLSRALARRMPKPVAEATAMTVAATLGTAPLMAMYFEQVSLAALPANLLAAPAIAPVMWLGVLASVAAQVAEPLATPFSALTAPMLVYLQQVAHATGATPVSVIDVHLSPAIVLAGTAVTATAIVLAARRWGHYLLAGPVRRRSWRWLIAPLAATIVLVAARQGSASPPPPGELVISFLDVGQGDATLIQLDHTAVLVDTGPPDGPILRRLKETGIRRLDALMLTHAEADHEGAAPQVIAAYHPRLVVDGGAGWPSRVQRVLASAARSVHAPAAGETIAVGALRFDVLWPPLRAPTWLPTGNPNDNALVTRLKAAGLTVLLTADAESNVLTPLAPGPVDVLKVSHHGSKDEGLPQLLAELHPRIAAIEVGRHNTYGHPAPSTLAALKGIPTLVRTDRDGTVRLHAANGRIWVQR